MQEKENSLDLKVALFFLNRTVQKEDEVCIVFVFVASWTSSPGST